MKLASALRSRFRLEHEDLAKGGRVYNAYLGNNPNQIARMIVNLGDNPARIEWSELSKQLHGMGLGKKLYGEVMRRMPGGVLSSDRVADLSDPARRVWDSMSKRPVSYSVVPGTKPESREPAFTGTITPKAVLPSLPHAPLPGASKHPSGPFYVSKTPIVTGTTKMATPHIDAALNRLSKQADLTSAMSSAKKHIGAAAGKAKEYLGRAKDWTTSDPGNMALAGGGAAAAAGIGSYGAAHMFSSRKLKRQRAEDKKKGLDPKILKTAMDKAAAPLMGSPTGTNPVQVPPSPPAGTSPPAAPPPSGQASTSPQITTGNQAPKVQLAPTKAQTAFATIQQGGQGGQQQQGGGSSGGQQQQ